MSTTTECGDQIYPPGPPCPTPTTTVPRDIVTVGNDAEMTQGIMAGGSLLLIAGCFAVVAARRHNQETPQGATS